MKQWTYDRKYAVYVAAFVIGSRFSQTISSGTAAEAFKEIYGAVHFTWGSCNECEGSGAYSYGLQKDDDGDYYKIGIHSMVDNGGWRGAVHMIHELGHIYDYDSEDPSKTMPSSITRNSLFPNGSWSNGSSGTFTANKNALVLQMHPPGKDGDSKGELYADVFVAWSLNVWNPSTAPLDVDAVNAAKAFMP